MAFLGNYFMESLWVGTCAGLVDTALNSELVLGVTQGFLPAGYVGIARSHQADKLNGALYSFSTGMWGFWLWKSIKQPLIGRRRK